MIRFYYKDGELLREEVEWKVESKKDEEAPVEKNIYTDGNGRAVWNNYVGRATKEFKRKINEHPFTVGELVDLLNELPQELPINARCKGEIELTVDEEELFIYVEYEY